VIKALNQNVLLRTPSFGADFFNNLHTILQEAMELARHLMSRSFSFSKTVPRHEDRGRKVKKCVL
jgi:hypothetical protein